MSTLSLSRVNRLKEAMQGADIDLLVCFNPENTCYVLNDFNAVDFSTPVVAILSRDMIRPSILIHSSQEVNVLRTPGERDVYTYGVCNGKLSDAAHWPDALARIFATLSNSSSLVIGTECSIRSDHCDILKSLARKSEFVEIDRVLQICRSIKDNEEITNSKMATHIANAGMRVAIQSLKSGDAWGVAEVKAKKAMGDEWQKLCPTSSIAGFGSEQSGGMFDTLQCRINSASALTNGEIECGMIPIRTSAAVNYRHAVTERSVCVGKVSEAQESMFSLAQAVHAQARLLIRPECKFNTVYQSVCDVLAKRHYEAPSHIGHLIGLGKIEGGYLDATTTTSFKPGMLVVVVTEVRASVDVAVRLADTYLVNESGCEYLCPFTE